jgi:phage terminase small subunit
MTQSDAYRTAYKTDNYTDKKVWQKASSLMALEEVRGRVTELRDQLASESVMSAQKRLEWLTELVKDAEQMTNDKLKAIDIMNKMTGEYTTKVEANVNNNVTIKIELTDD